MHELKTEKENFNFAGELQRIELKVASAKMPEGRWLAIHPGDDIGSGVRTEDLEVLGTSDISACCLLGARGGLAGVSVGAEKYHSPIDAIRDTQRLYRLVEQFQDGSKMERFRAAMAYEDCVFLWEAVEIGEHLDAYTFLSESEFREQTKQELAAKGMDPRILEFCFDFKRYAAIQYGYEDLYYSADTDLYVHKVDDTFDPCRSTSFVQDSAQHGQVCQPQMGV